MLVVLLPLPWTAAAQCVLSPPKVVTAPALAGRNRDVVNWGPRALVLPAKKEGGCSVLDVVRPGPGPKAPGCGLAVVTPSRALMVERNRLHVAPFEAKATFKAVGDDVRGELLDAVDGEGGETWVVVGDEQGLALHRLDGADVLDGARVVLAGEVLAARVTRLVDGTLAVASIGHVGARDAGVFSLWLSRFDAKGVARGTSLRVDGVAGQQVSMELALAASGTGVVVGWTVLAGDWKPRQERVPLELRAFQVEAEGAPRLTRRDPLTALAVATPESGMVLGPALQLASFDGRAAFLWQQLGKKLPSLHAAPALGGAASVLSSGFDGDPLLRVGPKSLVVLLVDGTTLHTRADLTCRESNKQSPALTPLDPPPALPDGKPLTRAQFDTMWTHLERLIIPAPKPGRWKDLLQERPKLEARLNEDEARRDGSYECLMAARSLAQLERCH